MENAPSLSAELRVESCEFQSSEPPKGGANQSDPTEDRNRPESGFLNRGDAKRAESGLNAKTVRRKGADFWTG